MRYACEDMLRYATQAHPFFRSVKWKLLLLKKLEPPLLPALSAKEPRLDISHFDPKY